MAETFLLFAIAAAVKRPVFRAFRLFLGAPGDGPPCIRHLPFAIAGDWHGFPLRVRAPQRFARCISKCMGLILRFSPYPTPLHVADNGLPAFVDVDMLHTVSMCTSSCPSSRNH